MYSHGGVCGKVQNRSQSKTWASEKPNNNILVLITLFLVVCIYVFMCLLVLHIYCIVFNKYKPKYTSIYN